MNIPMEVGSQTNQRFSTNTTSVDSFYWLLKHEMLLKSVDQRYINDWMFFGTSSLFISCSLIRYVLRCL